jgi:PAS domain S-box-containing protein
MRRTKHTAWNILILVNAVIGSGAFLLKIADPVVVSYTEEIRKADLFNFLVFTPIIMVVLTLLLRRELAPLVRLSALGDSLDREQTRELRSAAFSLPVRVLFLFNAVILSIVALVALGFDAAAFPFYPLYKRLISMGLIWSYTICSSLAVYVYVKRRMVPILRSTPGPAADRGPRTSIKTTMVAATVTLSATIFLFLSVYGYSKTREALIDDDGEAASAALYAVEQKAAGMQTPDSLKAYLASRATGMPVSLVGKNGASLAGPTTASPARRRLSLVKRAFLGAPFEGLSLAAYYRTGQTGNGKMKSIALFYLVLGVFFLFFAGTISYSVAGETSLALIDIEKRMRTISEDKETLFREFEVVSLDEVGDLTRSFNGLQRAVHRQTLLVKELEEKRHHLEKELLREAVEKATTSLHESESKFRTLAETTTAGIFIHRGDKLIYANPAGEAMTGYTNAEFLSMAFWELFHPDDRDFVRERGRARLVGKKLPAEYEFRILTKNGGTRWVNIAAGVIEYEGSPAVIATLFDVTDRRRAEEEKDALYEERLLEEKRHVAEKENILMELHDGIGGITTNISILSELAQNASDLDNVKKTLATISRLSREGMAEIRSFMQSLDARELNWRTLAAELRNQGSRMMEPHSIAFSLDVSLENVRDRIESVLWANLFKIYKEALTNIIKHSRAASVVVSLKLTEDRLWLRIRDDGVGGGAVWNSGRGLSNMRKRAQELGGSVTVVAENGSEVALDIPLPLRVSPP